MFYRGPQRFHLPIFIIAFILVSTLYFSAGFSASVQAAQPDPFEITVPTRTPTPNPDTGDDDNNNDGGNSGDNSDNNDGGSNNSNGSSGGSSNPAPPPTVAPTATPTTSVVIPTPVDGAGVPTACGSPIFVAIFGDTNVRSKPDQTTTVVGGLVFTEGRPIIARSSNDGWWKITLADGTLGWVSNAVGEVQGNINGLPILDVNDQPVTAPTWNPTPNPSCNGQPPAAPVQNPTALPQATDSPPTATATSVSEPPPPSDSTTAESVAPVAEGSDQTGTNETNEESAIVLPAATREIEETSDSVTLASEPTVPVVPSLTPVPASTEIASVSTTNQSNTGISSGSGITTLGDSTGPNITLWIILTGLGFLVVGIGTMIVQRRPST